MKLKYKPVPNSKIPVFGAAIAGLLLSMLFITNSCTAKFEEYNRDNTGFTDEQKAYDYNTFGILFKVIQMGIYFNYDWGSGKNWHFQTMQNLNADMFSGYMHDFMPFNAGNSNTVYNLHDGWNGTMWEKTYGYIMTEIKKTEDLAEDRYPSFYAIAQIMKVLIMHRVSDYYGPIVYTKFGESDAGAMPDCQQTAYYSFFEDLGDAIDLLTVYSGEETFSRFDMIMPEKDRSYRSWVRFGNALRLRLAVRIAMIDPQKAKLEANRSLNHPWGILDNEDELIAVSTAGTGYTNPLGEINKAWGEAFMNANMESILTGYEDPRLSKFFEPATLSEFKGEYRGIRQGTGFNHSRYHEHAKLTTTQQSPAILMTPAEVWFLRAEAALRGWSHENTEQCYQNGIRASFAQWRAGDVNSYLESDKMPADFIDTFTPDYSIAAVSRITPRWDNSASDEEKLERIITQKWIACFPEGCEAWAEQRRTGYPRLFPVFINKSNGKIDTEIMIRRLNFPVSIIHDNQAQYAALCDYLNGPDTGGTRLWWDTGRNF